MVEQARFGKGEAGRMRFMFETGLWGVEGKTVGFGKRPCGWVSKDGAMVF